MPPILQTEQVDQIFNRHRPDEVQALSDISLSIDAGETLALTGPSGSGKTSLLTLLGCMARPTRGRIQFNGRETTRLPERFLAEIRRQSFGFIFQQYHLLRDLSVIDNVLLPLLPTEMPAAEMVARAEETLSRFGLQHRLRMKVRQLSGGEQQRVAIARALINRPQVLIADEPTAHLDHDLAQELLNHLGQLKAEGTTLIIATHDPEIYRHTVIDRHIRLRDGALG